MSDVTCRNCGADLTGPYCAACGQKEEELRRPFWVLAEQSIEALLHIDHRFWHTLLALVARPGHLTREYIAGRRAGHFPPVRLFVIVTFAFFFAVWVSGVAILSFEPSNEIAAVPPVEEAGLTDAEERAIAAARQSGAVVIDGRPLGVTPVFFVKPDLSADRASKVQQFRADIEAAQAQAPDGDPMPEWVRRVSHGFTLVLENPMRMNLALKEWVPRILLLLVPVLAILMAFTFWWGARVFFIEHLMFSLHLHATLFAALTVMTAIVGVFGNLPYLWLVGPYCALYTFIAMAVAYGQPWWATVLRFLFVSLLYGILLVTSMAGAFTLALMEM